MNAIQPNVSLLSVESGATFAASDINGATDTLEVMVRVANVNRPPTLKVQKHAVLLGNELRFQVQGSDLDRNTTLTYSANGLPDTKGWMAELGYMPWLNTRLSLQATQYTKFNGGGSDYDGFGRNASDNNSLYLLVWFNF